MEPPLVTLWNSSKNCWSTPSGEQEPGAFEDGDTELDDFRFGQLGAGLLSDMLLHRGEGGGDVLIMGFTFDQSKHD